MLEVMGKVPPRMEWIGEYRQAAQDDVWEGLARI